MIFVPDQQQVNEEDKANVPLRLPKAITHEWQTNHIISRSLMRNTFQNQSECTDQETKEYILLHASAVASNVIVTKRIKILNFLEAAKKSAQQYLTKEKGVLSRAIL
mmetsp:Transcript_29327/g.67331  ORF Transcript_29327/g.67331 Transcript_29327/m.67331 type:complete len:107 (-) Transcript_29327:302-622(-)